MKPGHEYGPNFQALRDEGRPGHCLGCDARLPAHRKTLCGDAECRRIVHRAHDADEALRRKANPAAYAAWLAKYREGNKAGYQRLKADAERLAKRRAYQLAWERSHSRQVAA